jgi:hypothetical protein
MKDRNFLIPSNAYFISTISSKILITAQKTNRMMEIETRALVKRMTVQVARKVTGTCDVA